MAMYARCSLCGMVTVVDLAHGLGATWSMTCSHPAQTTAITFTAVDHFHESAAEESSE